MSGDVRELPTTPFAALRSYCLVVDPLFFTLGVLCPDLAGRHSLDMRTKNSFSTQLQAPAGATLDEVVWNVESLRTLMRQMLFREQVGPHNLLGKWRATSIGNKDGVDRHEFGFALWEATFQYEHVDLWQAEVCFVRCRTTSNAVSWLTLHAVIAVG